jgi:ATP-dependent RNA helicase DDX3X
MVSYEDAPAASAGDAASVTNLGSDADFVADGSVHESHVSHVQEDVPAGVLSGIGPNAEEAGQVARDKGWTDPVPFVYSELTSKEHRDWAGVAARYEWKDEYGDVGPAIPELEDQLFQSGMIPRAGIKLDK